MTVLKEKARGRWKGILPALGIGSEFLSGRHGPCPVCRAGKDRFRFDDKAGEGTWFCSQCGAGDGIKLVMLVNGIEFREAARRIEPLIGAVEPAKSKPQRSERSKRDAVKATWRSGKPVTLDDIAGRYLNMRTGVEEFPPSLRFVERLRYQEDGGEPSWHPALVAAVQGLDGKAVTLHRTYLTPCGRKADVLGPKKLMAGTVPHGSAIRLCEASGEIGIAEGIETAFSATALFHIPCWAAGNTSILEAWMPPEGVERVTIFADHDANFAGQKSAYCLAKRLSKDFAVRVRIPPYVGDWNDVLTAQQRQAA